MKKYLIIAAISLISVFSCTKEVNDEGKEKDNESSAAPTSFVVSSPETKTTLSGHSIKWAAGDKIHVYGHVTGTDSYDDCLYTIDSGVGTGSAVFVKEDQAAMTGSYDAFYAVYPSTKNLTFSTSNSELRMTVSKNEKTQTAVENGFDTASAIMTAIYDGDKLVFRHGVGYIRFVLSEDNVTKVVLNLGQNCLVQTPTYNAATGDYVSGAQGFSTITVNGPFIKGSAYYIPVIPRADEVNKHIETLIVTCTGGSTFTTDHFSGLDVEFGKIFNIGTLSKPSVPAINASNVNIEATDEGGTITYTVDNEVSGGVLTAAIQDAGTISNLALGTPSSGSLTFTCDANTEATAKTATVRLTYTYNSPAETVTKDVNIKQAASGGSLAPEEHTYIFCLNSSGGDAQTADGAPGAYFDVSGSSTLLCATSGSKPYFGVESYTIAGNVINYAKKIDSGNNVSFTTRTGFTSTVRFYCASRNTNTTATMKFNGTNYSLTWTDNKADLIDSGIINLSENTTYTFGKSGEVGLFYVIVEEVEVL